MSPRKWDLRVSDILTSIEDIENFTHGMTLDSFRMDRKTVLAVIRCLEVIGEASHKIPVDIQVRNPEIPWRKIKDFRTLLIHEYFGVDLSIVWNTIHTDLLPLKPAFEKIAPK